MYKVKWHELIFLVNLFPKVILGCDVQNKVADLDFTDLPSHVR